MLPPLPAFLSDLLGRPMIDQHSGDLCPLFPHSVHLGTGTPESAGASLGGGGGWADFPLLPPLLPLFLEPSLRSFFELLIAANQSESLLELPWSCVELSSSSMALLGASLPTVSAMTVVDGFRSHPPWTSPDSVCFDGGVTSLSTATRAEIVRLITLNLSASWPTFRGPARPGPWAPTPSRLRI